MDMLFDPNTVAFAKAIADETRQQIMKELCCQWLNVGQLAERIGVRQPTVSHHLKILNEANLLIKRREGKQSFCTLNQEMVTVCCGMLMSTFAPEQPQLITPNSIPVAG